MSWTGLAMVIKILKSVSILTPNVMTGSKKP